MAAVDSIMCPQCRERIPSAQGYVICPYCGTSLIKLVRSRIKAKITLFESIGRIFGFFHRPHHSHHLMVSISNNPDKKAPFIILLLISFLFSLRIPLALLYLRFGNVNWAFIPFFLFGIISPLITWILVFIGFAIPMWLVISLIFWMIPKLLGGKGSFGDTLSFVGYAFTPLILGVLINDILLFVFSIFPRVTNPGDITNLGLNVFQTGLALPLEYSSLYAKCYSELIAYMSTSGTLTNWILIPFFIWTTALLLLGVLKAHRIHIIEAGALSAIVGIVFLLILTPVLPQYPAAISFSARAFDPYSVNGVISIYSSTANVNENMTETTSAAISASITFDGADFDLQETDTDSGLFQASFAFTAVGNTNDTYDMMISTGGTVQESIRVIYGSLLVVQYGFITGVSSFVEQATVIPGNFSVDLGGTNQTSTTAPQPLFNSAFNSIGNGDLAQSTIPTLLDILNALMMAIPRPFFG